MKNKNRESAMKKFHQLYKTIELINDKDYDYCFYCGDPADTIDHVPPISIVMEELSLNDENDLFLVPACRQCNAVLSNKRIFSLYDRIQYVNDYLYKKYRREINTYLNWKESDNEFKDMGFSLKEMIRNSMCIGRAVKKRIEYTGHKIMKPYQYEADYLKIPRELPEYFQSRPKKKSTKKRQDGTSQQTEREIPEYIKCKKCKGTKSFKDREYRKTRCYYCNEDGLVRNPKWLRAKYG